MSHRGKHSKPLLHFVTGIIVVSTILETALAFAFARKHCEVHAQP